MINVKYFDKNIQYYVISDLHGQGIIYDNMMNWLEKEQREKGKKICLIINGDIIDRGNNSIRMLIDVMERTKNKKGDIDVVMLPGNHEEMMLSALEYNLKNGSWDNSSNKTLSNLWFLPDNYGLETLQELKTISSDKVDELIDFLRNLPLYCPIKSSVKGYNSYVIVHACPPSNAMISDNIPTLGMIVNDEKYSVLRECLIWRQDDHSGEKISLPDENVITIIGHTPVENSNGFSVSENGKLLMIDGGCALMANNPDSDLLYPKCASLLELSDVPGKTCVRPFGNEGQKYMREGRKPR